MSRWTTNKMEDDLVSEDDIRKSVRLCLHYHRSIRMLIAGNANSVGRLFD